MTIQMLIDILQKIENKELKVIMSSVIGNEMDIISVWNRDDCVLLRNYHY